MIPLKPHPIADIFPMISEEEYVVLREDIRMHGVREPIWLLENQILDGRNRYRACMEIGCRCDTKVYFGRDPIGFVVSLNLARRHLTPGQKADVSLRIIGLLEAHAKARQLEAGKRGHEGGRGNKKENPSRIPAGRVSRQGEAAWNAALATGASARNVQYQKKLRAEAPVLAEAVASGSLSIGAAVRQHAENQRKAELSAEIRAVLPIGLSVGDFLQLSQSIADESVELIFTDPPYNRDSTWVFKHLALVAARVLKPGGSVIAYCGQTQLPDVLSMMSDHLRYWWVHACVHRDRANQMSKLGIKNHWKPMVWFVKGTRGDVQTFVQDVVSGGLEKSHHEWQQSVEEAAYYIERLCSPTGIVYDPFAGGGTTLLAAKRLGRKWIASELNPVTAARIVERLESAS